MISQSSHIALAVLFSAVSAHSQTVLERVGNVIYTNIKGTEVQLTSSGSDAYPALSPDGKFITFVRHTDKPRIPTGSGDADPDELWLIEIETNKQEKLLTADSSDSPKYSLASFRYPQFSNDSRTIFFLSAAWAVSDAVHKINLKTKKSSFVTDANSLKIIRQGKYKGYLEVEQHRYRKSGEGSYDCLYIVTPSGKVVTLVKGSCEE